MFFSQWTVAGAAGPSGALAAGHATLESEGAIAQEPILLRLLGVVPAEERESGSTPAALSPASVTTWFDTYRLIKLCYMEERNRDVISLKV